MGCDVHMTVEVNEYGRWEGYLVNPYIGRNYTLFSFMAGVRGYFPESKEPRGMPTDASNETLEFHNKSQDFHSASYLSLAELREVVEFANDKEYEMYVFEAEEFNLEKPEKETYFHTYRALIKYMEHFENLGIESRVVFWFDS
jgi:hypothetical protein